MIMQGLIFTRGPYFSPHESRGSLLAPVRRLSFTVRSMTSGPNSMSLCPQTALMLGPLLPIPEANMGPKWMGPLCLMIKAQRHLRLMTLKKNWSLNNSSDAVLDAHHSPGIILHYIIMRKKLSV